MTPILAGFVVVAGCLLTGCTSKQSPDDLRRETAHATTVAKEDAKAVVEGVREGLKTDKPLDLNDATKAELTSLPGISSERADHIIAGRPYGSTDELVSRHILTEAEFDRIKDHVEVGKPSPGK